MICYWNDVVHIHFAQQSHLSLCCKLAVITISVYFVSHADFSYDSYSVYHVLLVHMSHALCVCHQGTRTW